jgi:NAD(P)-dependent dehydrogenase (short-subunit alcohol dehydrogenase family)
VDGFESTFAINHLAYFLLTRLLLDRLKASAPSRIVNVSSDAHRMGRLNFDDLQSSSGYNGYPVYARSKLANILFTAELACRIEGSGVTANALHPGVVATNFGKDSKGLFSFSLKFFRPFFLKPLQGAKTSIYLATSPDVTSTNGRYFERCAEAEPSEAARNPESARRLWEISEKLTGSA